MGMPAVVTATTLDFDEVHAAGLGLLPRGTSAELHERGIESIDVLFQRSFRLAEGEGDESDGSIFRECTDAVSDMSSSFSCTRVTKSIFALVARDAVHAGLAVRLQHPSMRATIVEAIRSVFCIGESFQGL